MRNLILGTAGHVDHGKTSLVRGLTGVDTDRLKEEKARGITIELGFAELDVPGRVRFGVVDVPGHEDFVRAMVAGAAGMDVVLLVVAADEGVMPQTREHLAIVELLGVPELVVALTKCDLVDADWLELVDADVESLLAKTPYAGAPRIPTSSARSEGLGTLVGALARAAERVQAAAEDDLVRLPLDRVFTLQGTGTVATGTLWSGTLRAGDRARILPHDLEAKVRSVQVHEREVQTARAGDRTAVALSGAGADRASVDRGATLVTSPDWAPTWMATAWVRVLPDAGWSLEQHQRVHVHHGTAEVLARCVLLDADEIGPGESGWVQLRLEAPLTLRARDRAVLRAYSPVTTIAGAVVAEARAPKRNQLDDGTRAALDSLVEGTPAETVTAYLDLQGWAGGTRSALPVFTGLTPAQVDDALADPTTSGVLHAPQRLFGAWVRAEAEELVARAVDAGHAADPLRPVISLAAIRGALPKWAPAELADAALTSLARARVFEEGEGGVRRPGHRPSLTPDQAATAAILEGLIGAAGLGAPSVEELPEDVRARADLWSILRHLESRGTLRMVENGLYLSASELDAAAERIRCNLRGQKALGPAAFKEILPVTRKRLLPLLAYFDGLGVTVWRGEARDVPE
ncbi:MAG: selenocysteine-specific translation elongation factor [Gemmatimonadetes bacterium]|nr:selenocysteine-specific translation elongation factor [Gemmatimonadota bacterium]